MAVTDAQDNAVIKYGEGFAVIELAGTVKAGDAVGYSGGWVRALATTAGVIQMRCVAGDDGVDGQKITAYFGTCIVEGGRFSGGTVGGALYVDEGTSVGKYTQTAPSDTGDATTVVGYALSATEMAITPNHAQDSVKA